MNSGFRLFRPALLTLAVLASIPAVAQDWVHTGSNLGNARIRIAAADFKLVGVDPQTPALKAAFDTTLYSDLANAGIFDLVSKSFAPQAAPGSPQEISLPQWAADPSKAAMVAFGALSATNGRLVVYGWLDDTRNTANPQVLGNQ
jgi:TolB protein